MLHWLLVQVLMGPPLLSADIETPLREELLSLLPSKTSTVCDPKVLISQMPDNYIFSNAGSRWHHD